MDRRVRCAGHRAGCAELSLADGSVGGAGGRQRRRHTGITDESGLWEFAVLQLSDIRGTSRLAATDLDLTHSRLFGGSARVMSPVVSRPRSGASSNVDLEVLQTSRLNRLIHSNDIE